MLITTRFIGPTNHRGARVKASFVGRDMSVTTSWDHALGVTENHAAAAESLVAKWNRDIVTSNPGAPAMVQALEIRGSFYCVAWDDRGAYFARVQDCQARAFRGAPIRESV